MKAFTFCDVSYNTLSTIPDRLYCCKGFCMDLLQELSRSINFTYSLALSPDGQFGDYIIRNYTQPGAKKEWTGLIGKLY